MNRDMVVKSITGCINNGEYCNECAYEGCIHRNGSCERDLLADALELIDNLEERIAIMSEGQPEIVRCKDCRWWHESEIHKGFGECGQANGIAFKTSDWYCADGERWGKDDG